MNQHLDKELVLRALNIGFMFTNADHRDLKWYGALIQSAIDHVKSLPDFITADQINLKE